MPSISKQLEPGVNASVSFDGTTVSLCVSVDVAQAGPSMLGAIWTAAKKLVGLDKPKTGTPAT